MSKQDQQPVTDLPADELVMMKVRDLPFPNVLMNSASAVAKLRRSIKGSRGYRPGAGDDPITILSRPGQPDDIINGNHRTEALKTASGLSDLQVPVLITWRIPAHLADRL